MAAENQITDTGRFDIRTQPERRTYGWRTLVFASVYRRRSCARRKHDSRILHSDTLPVASSLLALMVVMLSLLDAFLTTQLLDRGAVELNPFMDMLIHKDTGWFAFIKVKLTGVCIITLVLLANHRFFGLIDATKIAQLVLTGYLYLIAWELFLLG